MDKGHTPTSIFYFLLLGRQGLPNRSGYTPHSFGILHVKEKKTDINPSFFPRFYDTASVLTTPPRA